MPLPSPGAYREAQLAARAALGDLQEEALRNIVQALDELGAGLERELTLLGTQSYENTVRLARSRQIVRNQYNALLAKLQNITGTGRAMTYRQVLREWEKGGQAAASSVGIGGEVLGKIRAPAITMLGAYENLGSAASHWRTLLQMDATTAAREANLIARHSMTAGVGPDELGRRLRRYVTGSENYQQLFSSVPTVTGDVYKLDLRTLPRELRNGARQMVHNSNRIAFSEMHNARWEATTEHMIRDPLVGAIDWTLAQHRGKVKVPDECDVLATTNFYGLGPGRFPCDKIPRPPHPWDRCDQRPVPRSTRDMKKRKRSPRRVKTPTHPALKGVPATEAERILGRADDAVSFGEEAIKIRRTGIRPSPTPPAPPKTPAGKAMRPGQFTAVAQGELWARAKWPAMGFDLEGLSVEAVNDVLAEFEALTAQYPKVTETLKGISTGRNIKHIRGATYQFTGEIAHATNGQWMGLNPEYFSMSRAKFVEVGARQLESGFLKGSFGGFGPTVRHEFGHLIENYIRWGLGYNASFTPVALTEGDGLVLHLLEMWQKRPWKGLGKTIGRYATRDVQEKLAETFAAIEYGTPEAKASKWATSLKRLLDVVFSGRYEVRTSFLWESRAVATGATDAIAESARIWAEIVKEIFP